MSEEDDGSKDPLQPKLIALTGRTLTMGDVQKAVGLSKPQYYEARRQGKLITPNRLVLAAANLGINPVELLVACGVVTLAEAVGLVEDRRRQATEFWEATQPPFVTTTKRKEKLPTVTAKLSRLTPLRDAPPL